MSEKMAMVNFGGKMVAGTEYVYRFLDIEMVKDVIQYPKSLSLDSNKHKRTLESLSEAEKKVLEEAKPEPMTNRNKEVVIGKDGNPVMKPKTQDEIRFVFVNDETGSKTGPYDFVFRCYPGFRPQNDFKAFLLIAKGIDADTLSGNKNLFDIFKEGDKFVISTRPELRDGKWAQIDTTTIKPYVDGMALSKGVTAEEKAEGDAEIEGKLLDYVKENKVNALELMKEIKTGKFGEQVSVLSAYNRIKSAGKIEFVDGKIVVKA